MSASEKDRQENMVLALRLMMQDLREPYEWQEHDAKTPKFDAVLRTTWDELAERGLVKPRTFDRYELTGPGWIAGLKSTGLFDDEGFRRKAGPPQKALKMRINPENRDQWGMATRAELANETGLLHQAGLTLRSGPFPQILGQRTCRFATSRIATTCALPSRCASVAYPLGEPPEARDTSRRQSA